MNVKLFEYRLVDIEVSLEKAIKDRLVHVHPYYALSKESYAYKYFPADVGDIFAVISQEYHDGSEHIVGIIGLPDELPSYATREVEKWIMENTDKFISEDDLEDWL